MVTFTTLIPKTRVEWYSGAAISKLIEVLPERTFSAITYSWKQITRVQRREERIHPRWKIQVTFSKSHWKQNKHSHKLIDFPTLCRVGFEVHCSFRVVLKIEKVQVQLFFDILWWKNPGKEGNQFHMCFSSFTELFPAKQYFHQELVTKLGKGANL